MLIQITHKCNENCSHCMVNATPTGSHMDMPTFTKAVRFAVENNAYIINISGGEPTLHPEFNNMMKYLLGYLRNKNIRVVIESNGSWIFDERMTSFIQRILKHDIFYMMQISTNKKYYPNYDIIMSKRSELESVSPKIKFTHDWQGVDTNLKYMGRAVNIMSEDDIKGVPGCLNIVNDALRIMKWVRNPLEVTLRNSVERFHTCTPLVTPDGSIKLSEGCGCVAIDNVNRLLLGNETHNKKIYDDIYRKICEFTPCNLCKAVKNLTPAQVDGLNSLRELNKFIFKY